MFHGLNPAIGPATTASEQAAVLPVEHFDRPVQVLSDAVLDDISALAAFLDKYRDCSPHTLKAYAKETRRFVLWLRWHFQSGEPDLLRKTGKTDLNAYGDLLAGGGMAFPAAFLMANGWPEHRQPWAKPGEPAGIKTVQHAMLILRLFFEHLQDEGYLNGNPARAARKVRKSGSQNVRLREAFSQAEWQHVLDTIEALPRKTERDIAHYHRARWAIQLLYRAFLRREEAAVLRMGDFVQFKDHWEIHLTGKGKKEAEIVATSHLVEELKLYRTSLSLSPLPRHAEDRPAILDIHGQRAVSADTIYRICTEIFSRAAMEIDDESSRKRFLDASPHWLRHTGISHAMEADIDPRRVQAQARHSSLNTTTSIYDHKERATWAREMELM